MPAEAPARLQTTPIIDSRPLVAPAIRPSDTRRYAIYGAAAIGVLVVVAVAVDLIAGFHSIPFLIAELAALTGLTNPRGVTVLSARMLIKHLRDHRSVVMTASDAQALHGRLVVALTVASAA